MYPPSPLEDDINDQEADSFLAPLSNVRPGAMTVGIPGPFHTLVEGNSILVNGPSVTSYRQVVVPKRSMPQMRLQVSIPVGPRRPSLGSSSTPQSESPETPASITSPLAGVVDLTKHVTTISTCAAAHGGLSDIYKGEWVRTGGEGEGSVAAGTVVVVAIKVLRIFNRKDQDGVRARKRLNREVYVWHRLEHPNVVKLFGTSYHMSGRPAMVMQWYHNGSAAEYLAKKNPSADRLQLILDVARGLEYLHTHKPPIIHADLKGNNVLITDDGRAVLCDFGLSQVVEDLGRPSGMTLSNPDVGPLRWQAPEFMEDDDSIPTTSSDIWSFGCTAYELLTSTIPYAHRHRDAQVIRDMQNGIKPPGPADLSLLAFGASVQSLLDDCWSYQPEERPHITDIRAQLEAICAQ